MRLEFLYVSVTVTGPKRMRLEELYVTLPEGLRVLAALLLVLAQHLDSCRTD